MLACDDLTDSQIERIMAFARDNGGIDAAYQVMTDLRDRARQLLDTLPQCEVCRQLAELFDFVIERQY